MDTRYDLDKYRRRQQWFYFIKKRKPAEILVVSFALTILTGAFFLMLPISSATDRCTRFLNALYVVTFNTSLTTFKTKWVWET